MVTISASMQPSRIIGTTPPRGMSLNQNGKNRSGSQTTVLAGVTETPEGAAHPLGEGPVDAVGVTEDPAGELPLFLAEAPEVEDEVEEEGVGLSHPQRMQKPLNQMSLPVGALHQHGDPLRPPRLPPLPLRLQSPQKTRS